MPPTRRIPRHSPITSSRTCPKPRAACPGCSLRRSAIRLAAHPGSAPRTSCPESSLPPRMSKRRSRKQPIGGSLHSRDREGSCGHGHQRRCTRPWPHALQSHVADRTGVTITPRTPRLRPRPYHPRWSRSIPGCIVKLGTALFPLNPAAGQVPAAVHRRSRDAGLGNQPCRRTSLRHRHSGFYELRGR